MIQLTSRQQAILVYLLQLTSPVPVREIARRYNLGQRTIRYDLDAVEAWLRTQGGQLMKRPKVGVQVQVGDTVRRQLQQALDGGSVVRVMTPEERSQVLYCHLLLREDAVTAEQLAGQVLVSRPTVMNDLRALTQSLGGRLQVVSKKGEGYRLQGEETHLRAALVDTLQAQLTDSHSSTRYSLTNRGLSTQRRDTGSPRDLALDYLAGVDLDALGSLLDYTREMIYYTMPESDHVRFLLYLAVLVRRVGRGQGALPPTPREDGEQQREHRLADLLEQRLAGRFRLTLGRGERDHLVHWLISCNIKFPPKADDQLAQRLSSIVDEMLGVLDSYPGYLMPEFYRDKLKVNLLSHLRLTIKKYHLQIASPNPLLTQMRVNYPEIFAVVYQMAKVFETATQIPLGQDEMGFIAIHIAASIEECLRLGTKKALIICNTGRGAAMVLHNRIRNNIPRLEITGTLSALDAENAEALRGVDFVISTVELPELDKPVFRVSPIISASEINQINRYLGAPAGDSIPHPQPDLLPGQPQWEENAMFQTSMILARIGGTILELDRLYDMRISGEQLFGMVIHILMSIPRWRKGDRDREYASEQYKQDNREVYDQLVRQLRDIAAEYDLPIPDKEALALMRYFI